MAEDFPHYQEDDDDDAAPIERAAERHEPPAPPPAPERESAAPNGQEGTIFSRDHIAPSLSRPLFEFIRNQEQPEAKVELPEEHQEAVLPSVSAPGEPETRTYQPPAEVLNEAELAGEADDDDDDEAGDQPTQTASAPPARPVPQHRETPTPTLHEQFEDIMRREMGEDFAQLTSGNTLAELELEPEPEVAAVTQSRELEPPRAFVPEWPAPVIPESSAEASSVEDEGSAAATAAAAGSTPSPSNSEAFFYSESEDEHDPAAADPADPYGAPRTHASGGIPPLPPPRRSSAAASGGFPPGSYSMNMAPAIAPENIFATPPSRQERSHNGRWFVAGVLTGWLLKQHFANKKMRAVQAEQAKTNEAQNEQIDNLQYMQHHTEQRLKQTESQLQAAQVEQTRAKQAAQTAESARLNQEQTARYQAAARESSGIGAIPSMAEQIPAAATLPVAEQSAARPQSVAEQAQAYPQQQEYAPQQPDREHPQLPTMETPLQHVASGAELPVAAAAAYAAEARPNALGTPIGPEAAAARPAQAGEAQPKSERAIAEDLVNKAYELHNGQHVEHAAGGGHNIIVDKHGHEVQNAMEYGEEFHAQQRQEQLRAGILASDGRPVKATVNGGGTQGGYAGGGTIVTGLASGQIPPSHDLPAGPVSGKRKHLMAGGKSQNPVVATVASPWLWASVIVLLAAFFIAAFV